MNLNLILNAILHDLSVTDSFVTETPWDPQLNCKTWKRVLETPWIQSRLARHLQHIIYFPLFLTKTRLLFLLLLSRKTYFLHISPFHIKIIHVLTSRVTKLLAPALLQQIRRSIMQQHGDHPACFNFHVQDL